jgi:hypothetical protein
MMRKKNGKGVASYMQRIFNQNKANLTGGFINFYLIVLFKFLIDRSLHC